MHHSTGIRLGEGLFAVQQPLPSDLKSYLCFPALTCSSLPRSHAHSTTLPFLLPPHPLPSPFALQPFPSLPPPPLYSLSRSSAARTALPCTCATSWRRPAACPCTSRPSWTALPPAARTAQEE